MSKMVNMKQRVSRGDALDIFSITFATVYVEVKTRPWQGHRIICFGYVYVLTGAKIFQTMVKNN